MAECYHFPKEVSLPIGIPQNGVCHLDHRTGILSSLNVLEATDNPIFSKMTPEHMAKHLALNQLLISYTQIVLSIIWLRNPLFFTKNSNSLLLNNKKLNILEGNYNSFLL